MPLAFVRDDFGYYPHEIAAVRTFHQNGTYKDQFHSSHDSAAAHIANVIVRKDAGEFKEVQGIKFISSLYTLN